MLVMSGFHLFAIRTHTLGLYRVLVKKTVSYCKADLAAFSPAILPNTAPDIKPDPPG